jgi:hypothetical protein
MALHNEIGPYKACRVHFSVRTEEWVFSSSLSKIVTEHCWQSLSLRLYAYYMQVPAPRATSSPVKFPRKSSKSDK